MAKLCLFQSTPPRGRRRASTGASPGRSRFNPRLRAGGDFDQTLIDLLVRVSIHASAREATPAPADSSSRMLFQSTPPRGRRRDPTRDRRRADGVSIHASAREATHLRYLLEAAGIVSIHASAREATSHRRERSQPSVVSIHASAREATLGTGRMLMHASFQSTPPRGRRPDQPAAPEHQQGFNPRLRAGGDDARLLEAECLKVSIHASAREATATLQLTENQGPSRPFPRTSTVGAGWFI